MNKSDDKSTLNVNETNEKIDKLTKVLEANSQFFKLEVDETLSKSRQSVIECLKDNKGKSLNCWDEVEEFRKLVKQL